MSKVKIGISIGDINGIGPEVIIKALSNEMLLHECTPIIYGSSKVMGYHKNVVKKPGFNFVNISRTDKAISNKVNVISCWQDNVIINLSEPTEESGKRAHIALDRAVNDLNKGYIDALVTAPINKSAMQQANFPYPGHTEFLAEQCGKTGEELMLLISDEFKVALVNAHVPISEVSGHISKKRIYSCIKILDESLKKDFGKEKPTIAVLGLNPHAGDNGAIGSEEEEVIRPAIIELKKKGLLVSGPYSADGFFGNALYRKFDAILAMYHDQGLIPFKALTFGSGVNFTAGLPIIRTSPDHGTGYDIAGQNIADESSMRQAIYAAIDIFKSRKEYSEMHQHKLEKINIESEGEIA